MTTLFRTPFRDNYLIKMLIGGAVLIAIVIVFPHPESAQYSYPVGTVWLNKDLVAPFSFAIYKDLRAYEDERTEAMRGAYPVIERHDELQKVALDSLHTLFRELTAAGNLHARWMKSRGRGDSLLFAQVSSPFAASLLPGEWNAWEKLAHATNRRFSIGVLETRLAAVLGEMYRIGIYDPSKLKFHQTRMALRRGNEEDIIGRDKLVTPERAMNEALTFPAAWEIPDDARTLLHKILAAVVRPNLVLNEEATNEAIQAAEESVPRTLGIVEENERVVSKGDRITELTRLKLDSFRRARAERGSEFAEWKHWTGIVFHICLVLGLYGVYIYLFRKKIFHDNGKLIVISFIILIEAFLAYLSVVVNGPAPLEYLILVPAASMLLSIIFDSRVAFYGTVAIAFLVAGIRGNDYGFAMTSMIAGAMSAYTVRDIRNRTQIFRSLGFIFAAYALSIFALSLEQYDRVSEIFPRLSLALANAVCSPVLAYGLLIFFERVFLVTTDLRLLELANLNQPLLRRLSEEAPGTFHHSLTIGNLAEAAADAIGANSILARVGGYYHDIGKILKPEYFVENQVGPQNRHARLKPRMSALIIQSHVKEGVELGREYRLPEALLDFIPQHHGTGRISFFYDKALKQAARRPTKEVINEEDFRYPGPKPQTREAAIIMLADSVEASTRALSEFSPLRIRQAIESITQQRFVEGQLDECELTLRDLSKIKDAFYTILLGIYHQRVVYPGQEAQEQAAAESPQPQESQENPAPIQAPAPEVQPAVPPAAPIEPPPAPVPPAEPVRVQEEQSSGGMPAS